jgi:DNA-binding MurR/RpiR family transcriptional regulator
MRIHLGLQGGLHQMLGQLGQQPAVARSNRRPVARLVVRTLEEVPEGATHWSKRELAKRVRISPTSVLRIWRAFGLQPWRRKG